MAKKIKSFLIIIFLSVNLSAHDIEIETRKNTLRYTIKMSYFLLEDMNIFKQMRNMKRAVEVSRVLLNHIAMFKLLIKELSGIKELKPEISNIKKLIKHIQEDISWLHVINKPRRN